RKPHGSVRSITTATLRAPILTSCDDPSRSPLCDVALPDFETRATTTTDGNFESAKLGAIAIVSSSVNESGRPFTCLRRIASGIFGPSVARAKTKTVSVGAAFAATCGARFTVPAIVAPDVADSAFALDGGADAASAEVNPPRLRASAMLASIDPA